MILGVFFQSCQVFDVKGCVALLAADLPTIKFIFDSIAFSTGRTFGFNRHGGFTLEGSSEGVDEAGSGGLRNQPETVDSGREIKPEMGDNQFALQSRITL